MQSNLNCNYDIWTEGESGGWAEGKVDDSIGVTGRTGIRGAVFVDLARWKWQTQSRKSEEDQVQK